MSEPRIRVSAVLRRQDRILLCRHEKADRHYWLLPGGGVKAGESLTRALLRELVEEVGIFEPGDELPLEGPIAVVDSIAPDRSPASRHVVHIVFAADLGRQSLELARSDDERVRGHRLFARDELDGLVLHPPIQRFLQRWRPGDPVAYLGELWSP